MVELAKHVSSKTTMKKGFPRTRKPAKAGVQLWLTISVLVMLSVIACFVFSLESSPTSDTQISWVGIAKFLSKRKQEVVPWALTEHDLHSWNLPKIASVRNLKSTHEGFVVNKALNCNPLDRLGVACCGHRGASMFSPENTIPSFLEAFREGATCVEMDVHLTRDFQLAVVHPRNLNEMVTNDEHSRNATLVDDMSLAELKRVDLRPLVSNLEFFDSEVPSLGEVFEALWELPVQLVVELKVDGQGRVDRRRVYTNALVNFLEEFWGTRALDPPAFQIVFFSFDQPFIDMFGEVIKAVSPSLSESIRGYGYVLHPKEAHDTVTIGKETSVVAIHHSRIIQTKNLWYGVKYTLSWLTDDLGLMEDQVKQGVDAVITNDPRLCRAMCSYSTSSL